MRAAGDYVPPGKVIQISPLQLLPHAHMMTGSYDPLFVILSVVIAALAS
jgi:hypothetical protein